LTDKNITNNSKLKIKQTTVVHATNPHWRTTKQSAIADRLDDFFRRRRPQLAPFLAQLTQFIHEVGVPHRSKHEQTKTQIGADLEQPTDRTEARHRFLIAAASVHRRAPRVRSRLPHVQILQDMPGRVRHHQQRRSADEIEGTKSLEVRSPPVSRLIRGISNDAQHHKYGHAKRHPMTQLAGSGGD